MAFFVTHLRENLLIHTSQEEMKHALLTFILLVFCSGLAAQSLSQNSQTEDLRVFPNPVVEYFKIGHSKRVETINLMNMAGRIVKRFTYSEGNIYNVAELHRGLYLLQMRDDQNKVVKTVRLNKR